MTRYLYGLAAILLIASAAQAQAPAGAGAPTAATAETQVRTFLFNLQGGNTTQAVDALLAASTTPAQKPGEREGLLAQIGAAIQAYGPVTAYEKARTDMLGTMAMRQYYLVQHRDMVVRWEFDFVRAGAGWKLDYFSFDDQPRTWF